MKNIATSGLPVLLKNTALREKKAIINKLRPNAVLVINVKNLIICKFKYYFLNSTSLMTHHYDTGDVSL